MKAHLRFAWFLGLIGSSLALFGNAAMGEENTEKPEAGIEVLARGPVHEAYAQPTEATAQPGIMVPKKPPDPIAELPPDEKPNGDNVQWIPGYWAWDSDRNDFLWVSGFWRAVPPGRKWVPGHWTEAEGGWQWTTGFWASDSQQDVQYLPPPPPTVDNGPSIPAPDEDSTYVPGCWVYRSTRYIWRPGFWADARPGWAWTPAHYCYTPAGYLYVDGYWDYAPEDRGLLFAPVYFDQPLWTNPSWCYRPRFAIGFGSLLSCLFVRPAYCHYYFGDFYGPSYAGLGFQPWFAYGPRHHDPLFGYYGWRHQHDYAAWYGGLRNTFVGRNRGDLPRPPHTLAQQNIHSVQIVKPLSQFRDSHVHLTRLSAAQVAEHARNTQRFRDMSMQRHSLERPGRTAGTPRSLPLGRAPVASRPNSFGSEFHSMPAAPGAGHTPANLSRPSIPHTAHLAPRAPGMPEYRPQHFGGASLAPGRLPHVSAPTARQFSHSHPGVIAPRPSYPHAVTHSSSRAGSFAPPRSVPRPAHASGGHSGHHK